MNTEELEQSLRTEFENYLKTFLADMRKDVDDFQERLRSQFEEAFRGYTARFDSELKLSPQLASSLSEHLRLARDEGARIAADAMSEAEKMTPAPEPVAAAAPAPPPAPARYNKVRDAVAAISSKDSQASILKTLVEHAGGFAPRGAFFVIKGENLVGWKTFGAGDAAEARVRDIKFASSEDTLLGDALRSLSPIESMAGSHAADGTFLEPLGFGSPEGMFAVPLMARGRGVAVLYVDNGTDGGNVNIEAIETLVRVAGLTVELLAAGLAPTPAVERSTAPEVAAAPAEAAPDTAEAPAEEVSAAQTEETPAAEVEETPVHEVEAAPVADESYEAVAETEAAAEPETFAGAIEAAEADYQAGPTFETSAGEPTPFDTPSVETATPFDTPAGTEAQADPFASPFSTTETVAHGDIVFDTKQEPNPFEQSPFARTGSDFEPAAAVPSGGFVPSVETVMEAPVVTPTRSRLSDRNVDLPIEVAEDERRIHNDARRFARLLVSEIKLYNEKKVIEGRESGDLYDRLREAVDRSREMYEKRVQPPVAAKFDYFHYELVNSLADGDPSRLGSSYPGATV